VGVELDRPDTAISLGAMLEQVQYDRTPTLERAENFFGEKLGDRTGTMATFTLPDD